MRYTQLEDPEPFSHLMDANYISLGSSTYGHQNNLHYIFKRCPLRAHNPTFSFISKCTNKILKKESQNSHPTKRYGQLKCWILSNQKSSLTVCLFNPSPADTSCKRRWTFFSDKVVPIFSLTWESTCISIYLGSDFFFLKSSLSCSSKSASWSLFSKRYSTSWSRSVFSKTGRRFTGAFSAFSAPTFTFGGCSGVCLKWVQGTETSKIIQRVSGLWGKRREPCQANLISIAEKLCWQAIWLLT